MPEIIDYDVPVGKTVLARIMITDVASYLDARADADKLAKKYGLVVASMPRLIGELQFDVPRKAIRAKWADVNSAEYNGRKNSEDVYVVGHSAGPFSTTEGLQNGWQNMIDYGFMPVDAKVWNNFMKNKNLFPLAEIKGNRSFDADEFKGYGIIADVKDMNIYDGGPLNPDQFMNSDRILMLAGSEAKREQLANVIFDVEKRSTFGDYHRIKEADFSAPNGRPVFLDYDGFDGINNININGRFGLVAPEAHSTSAKQNAQNSLEGKVVIEGNNSFNHQGVHYEFNGKYYAPTNLRK